MKSFNKETSETLHFDAYNVNFVYFKIKLNILRLYFPSLDNVDGINQMVRFVMNVFIYFYLKSSPQLIN